MLFWRLSDVTICGTHIKRYGHHFIAKELHIPSHILPRVLQPQLGGTVMYLDDSKLVVDQGPDASQWKSCGDAITSFFTAHEPYAGRSWFTSSMRQRTKMRRC